jgi:two-component system sensor histidine kinase TctE
MTDVSRKPSLRNRLMRHVLVPLAATWLVGSALVVGIASYFAQLAFDRSLLDDAYLVASHVRRTADDSSSLELSLSAQEMSTVLFDQSESLYFSVLSPTGNLLAGHAGLKPDQFSSAVKPEFAAMEYQGRMLRTVTIHRQEPGDFFVVMAQTTVSRDRLLHRLFTFSIVPQLLLLVLLAAWL